MDQRVIDEFGLFCLRKKGVCGPDVHMKTAGAGTAFVQDPLQRAWYLAVYNNFCSSPSGAVIYGNFQRPEDLLSADDNGLNTWIRQNWKGIPIRQNRRPARSVDKLARSLVTLAYWMIDTDDGFHTIPSMTYEEVWKSLDAVYTWGRYVKIKFLETCRLFLGPEYAHLVAPDIHGNGGWSPRKALGFIYPEYATILNSKNRNDKQTLALINSLAEEVQAYVTEKWVPVSLYELEALLCNYKQTLSTRKAFYVGRTIDSELEYDRKIREFWGRDPYRGQFDFFETRKVVFPHETLGELQGWDGVRLDLSPLLLNYGIVWSDVVYDYLASREDLEHPVKRPVPAL